MPLSDAELKELQELEATYGNARPQVQGMSDAEKAELEQLEKQFGGGAQAPQAQAAQVPGLDQAMQDVGMTGGLTLEPARKGLDYLGGLGRTAVGAGLGAATGNDVIQEGDVMRALQGEAVPGEELLKRAEVPEGGRANLFPEVRVPFTDVTLGKGDTSAREAAGFGLEVLSDPLTYGTLGAAPALKKALSPVARATEAAGNTIYKSGLKRVDLEAAKYGKEPVSDILMKEGAWGTAGTIQKTMDALGAEKLARRDALLAEATRQGGEVSMGKAMAPLRSEIEKIKSSKDPELQKLAKAFQKKADAYQKLDRPAKENIFRELPVQQKYIAPQTELATVMGPGGKSRLKMTDPATQFEEVGNLPSSADYMAQTRELPSDVGPLPVGNKIQPLDTVTTRPDELGPNLMKYPTKFNVEMGQVVPEGTRYSPQTVGLEAQAQGRRLVPAREIQEQYIPQFPEIAQDVTGELDLLRPEKNILGVDPKQASAMKTTAGANLPQSAWQDYKINTAAQRLTKAMQAGLRKQTEESVGKAIGHGAEKDLISLNDELGRILTTREKQAMEAAIEKKKNYFTSIDAGLAGNMLRDPVSGAALFAGKKTGDLFKTTAFRTGVGKGLNRLGAGGRTGPAMDILTRRTIASPWQSMETKRKNGR